MQPGRLEEPVAIRRRDLLLEGAAVTLDLDRNLHSRLAQRPDAAEHVGKAADLLLANARTDKGGLNRVYDGAGKASRVPGYLDDYTHFVHGLLCLQEATGEAKWLDAARLLTDRMITLFGDKQSGGFFYSSNEHETLFARSKDQFDGAIPSGNSMAARMAMMAMTTSSSINVNAQRDFMFLDSINFRPVCSIISARFRCFLS